VPSSGSHYNKGIYKANMPTNVLLLLIGKTKILKVLKYINMMAIN